MGKELTVRVETMPDMAAEIHRMQYQVQLIQQAMKEIMKQDVHYGIIPGTKKPTLYKAGAEKICLLFRLRPTFECEEADLGSNHKQYSFVCKLHSAKGEYVGQGVGSCSTMENKYQWRRSEGEDTGQIVPKAYWNLKKSEDPKQNAEAVEMLGGKGFFAKKDAENTWKIFKAGSEKVQNPDVADLWNTCLKMAKKRAFIDAALTCTGASDCFDQDLDDNFKEDRDPEPDVDPASDPAPKFALKFIYDLNKIPEDKRKMAEQYAIASNASAFGEEMGWWVSDKRITKLDNAFVEARE